MLLPLIAGMAVHAARPLFPADIARALGELPAPRVLVSTPVHLRALVESPQQFPEAALIVSATAPLDRALAQAVEAKLGGRLLEIFGSTETCAFASRRTAQDEFWRLHEGVVLEPVANGTLVTAPWHPQPILLQDHLELRGAGEFRVRGRNTDLIEVAGKRASLADLTRRVLAIEGVQDAVVFQPGRGFGRDDTPRRRARGRARSDCGTDSGATRGEHRPGVPAAPTWCWSTPCRATSSASCRASNCSPCSKR